MVADLSHLKRKDAGDFILRFHREALPQAPDSYGARLLQGAGRLLGARFDPHALRSSAALEELEPGGLTDGPDGIRGLAILDGQDGKGQSGVSPTSGIADTGPAAASRSRDDSAKAGLSTAG